MAKLLLINGPNLNLLGTREPAIYGKDSLATIVERLQHTARELGHELEHVQSNAEHELIDSIHQALPQQIKFILINPGALTHTSIALRDAFLGVHIPFIEIHISNVYAREPFRHYSYLTDIAQGFIGGVGIYGYHLALLAACHHLQQQNGETHGYS